MKNLLCARTMCSTEGLHTETHRPTQTNTKGCQETHETSKHTGPEDSMKKRKSRESAFDGEYDPERSREVKRVRMKESEDMKRVGKCRVWRHEKVGK